ncbi:MAG: metal-dependent transcriptional regulator [Caldilineaceae bacterium]|nr:metal-dependent transcriptional regulator [Caldilineaceae bacterium]MBP8108317.1 metal-dependent transcriptional regulator [Caldilineaceae bacterium]MBP8124035.1 metal-dependent transcriptional regulator [Caldilineaceae bacterium]MBP9071865.1 metal-dependent transcriptional regulator [Caldilineaceae bacterium]
MTKKEFILTSSHEDYLKTIYTLQRQGQEVSNSALARSMSVAPASATNMVKKLADLNLVTYEPYQGVLLSEAGRRVALEVLRHHRLLELFLHQALDMPWDQVHAEAERLEHVISETLEDAIAAALGHPTVDPHGDPIPSKDLVIQPTAGVPLSQAPVGVPLCLVRVMTQDAERLCYLGALGLYPNTQVIVDEKAPFDGPLLIAVAGNHHALSVEMAEMLIVQVVGE